MIFKKSMEPLKNKGFDLVTNIPTFDSVKHALYNSRNTAFQVKKTIYKNFTEVEVPV